MDVYCAVDKEILTLENTTLSGKFLSKVYEGPFKDTGKWCKDFEEYTKKQRCIYFEMVYVVYHLSEMCKKIWEKLCGDPCTGSVIGGVRISSIKIIDLTPETIADYGVCGYKDVKKHLELRRKIEWFTQYYPKGLHIKALISEKGGYQGMLEYIPGKYAHRPVDAEGYMFIHCIFVGFKNEFKGKGHASRLIDGCFKDAEKNNMLGLQ